MHHLDLGDSTVLEAVYLAGASIGGDILIDGLTINGSDDRGFAFDLSNLSVRGNVLCRDRPLVCKVGALRSLTLK